MASQRFKYYIGLQAFWIMAAIVMNSYSYHLESVGQAKLTTTDPLTGIGLFLLYAPTLVVGLVGWYKTYLSATLAFSGMIFFGGVLKHMIATSSPQGMEGYASELWWLAAISLNIFGLVASAMAIYSIRLILSERR